jgi:hypothetical protein
MHCCLAIFVSHSNIEPLKANVTPEVDIMKSKAAAQYDIYPSSERWHALLNIYWITTTPDVLRRSEQSTQLGK